VNLDLEINFKDEAFIALGDDLLQLAVEIVSFGDGVGPVEIEDSGRNDLGFVTARVERIFTGTKRLLPDAATAGMNERAILEFVAGRVLSDEADVSLDDRDLALLDDHHGDQLDADEKRIERVGTVEKRVVLEADFSAAVEEGLKILIVVVELIFAAEKRFDDFLVGGAALLHFSHVGEAAEAAGDVAGRKRIALVGGDDTDDVNARAFLTLRLRLDAKELELVGGEAKRGGRKDAVAVDFFADFRGDGEAINLAARNDEKRDRVDRDQSAGRQYGALDTLLAAILGEALQVGEIAELFFVNGGFRADGKRLADLSDDHADLARRDLDPGIFIDGVHDPWLPAEAGHEEVGLIAGFPVEGDGIVLGQFFPGKALGDQADFCRSDPLDGMKRAENEERTYDDDDDAPEAKHERLDSPGRSRDAGVQSKIARGHSCVKYRGLDARRAETEEAHESATLGGHGGDVKRQIQRGALLAIVWAACLCGVNAQTPQRVIIDTDPGTDDALAILLAFDSPEIRVEALTVVAGNVTSDVGLENALKVASLAGRCDVPIARGARKPLAADLNIEPFWNGSNGLGGAELPAATCKADARFGPDLIIEMIHKYPHEITLVPIGPLTNIALAVLKDPSIVPLTKGVVLMGGSISGGNVNAAAEFNVYCDPEAASTVFNAGWPITMVGLDVTEVTLLHEPDAQRLEAKGGPQGKFAAVVARFQIGLYQGTGFPGGAIHDALAVGAAIDPMFVKTRAMRVDVETGGKYARGATLANRDGTIDKVIRVGDHLETIGVTPVVPNVNVAIEADSQRLIDFFVERVGSK